MSNDEQLIEFLEDYGPNKKGDQVHATYRSDCNRYTLEDGHLVRPERVTPVKSQMNSSPWDEQVDGNHYKQYPIQPYTFFYWNEIPHHKAAVIRRILRYDHEDGKGVKDLNKIAHEIELIKDLYTRKG